MNYSFDRKKKKAEWPAFVDIEEWKIVTPQIHIISSRCKECRWCIEFCPEEILEISDEINEKGYHPPRLIEGKTFENCVECHFCELICPEFAIFVKIPTKEEEMKVE